MDISIRYIVLWHQARYFFIIILRRPRSITKKFCLGNSFLNISNDKHLTIRKRLNRFFFLNLNLIPHLYNTVICYVMSYENIFKDAFMQMDNNRFSFLHPIDTIYEIKRKEHLWLSSLLFHIFDNQLIV